MKKLLIICLFILIGSEAFCAFRPLEIGLPKTAGSGTPAIPSDHPVFRAYTGITYNIRPSIIGGLYPFTYAISGEPTGMTINANTGGINWPSPTAGTTGVITLTVTDSELTQVQSSWQIVVGTTGYLFIDPSYSGTETGSITQPYSTILNMVTNATNSTDIVYFRDGTHHVPVFQSIDGNNADCNMDYSGGRPTRWIGYPGENPIIDMDSNYLQGAVTSWYVDDLTFIDIPDWLIHEPQSALNYTVFRRNDCSGARLVYRTDNGNQGTFYTYETTDGYYMTVQDNVIHGYNGVQGFGSLYRQDKLVIQDNHFYDFTLNATVGNRAVLAMKWDCEDVFIRHNNIEAGPVPAAGASANSYYANFDNVEISFNRIQSDTIYGIYLNNNPTQTPTNNTFIYRNTFDGCYPIISSIEEGACYGPFVYQDNVIVNENNSGYDDVDHHAYRYPGTNYLTCVSITDDLTGVSADNIINSDGLLVGTYRDDYLGTRGWETVAATPDTIANYVGCDFSGVDM